jgi:hypothetical protein
MNDDMRKRLTEYLEECWHELSGPQPIDRCVHCDKLKYTIHNRTFTTPDDMDALRRKLVEKGDWIKFQIVAHEAWKKERSDEYYVAWLMEPERFCSLVAEWFEEKEER